MRLRAKKIILTLFSLLTVYSPAQTDAGKLMLSLSDSAAKYMHSNYTMARAFADSAMAVAKRSGENKNLGGAFNTIGNVYLANGNYDLALEQFVLAEKYARLSNQRALLGRVIENQAVCYERKGNYNQSFDKHFRALVIRQEVNNQHDIALSYQNMAATYFYIGDVNGSINSTKKAIAIVEKLKDYKFLGELYSNLGVAYFNQYKDSMALRAYLKALELARMMKDKDGITNVSTNLAGFYNGTGQPQKALEILTKIRQDPQPVNPEKNLDLQINVATTFMNLNKRDSALFYYNKSLDMAKALGFSRKIAEIYDLFYEFYMANGDYKNALEYRNKFFTLNDSVMGERNLKNIAELEAIYKSEKKNKEIEFLNAENKLQKENSENRKKLLWISLAGLLLALFAAFAFYRNFRNKKRDNVILQGKNEEIQKQKDLIAEKNKEIVASINYAKRLQEAILPPVESIKKQLPHSFIVYKPKDIVAGDFYWMHIVSKQKEEGRKQGESLLIAVADCTGHGVPGAMVSVVCANALNAAVKEFGLTEPAKILDKVNELVEETFGKNSDEVRDGMDISLVKIELVNDNPENKLPKGKMIIPKGKSLTDVLEGNKKYEIQWAGANNPLWYITNGEWKEIEADKQPVGKFINRKPFTNHRIELKKEDSLFLFSDGFADQFGGEKGKKIKNKYLKELLYKNSEQASEQQKQILEKEFDSWKEGYEQVDDVCIIGIKL